MAEKQLFAHNYSYGSCNLIHKYFSNSSLLVLSSNVGFIRIHMDLPIRLSQNLQATVCSELVFFLYIIYIKPLLVLLCIQSNKLM